MWLRKKKRKVNCNKYDPVVCYIAAIRDPFALYIYIGLGHLTEIHKADGQNKQKFL